MCGTFGVRILTTVCDSVFLLLLLAQGVVTRDVSFSVPLKSGVDQDGVDWGEIGRKADHATVAISAAKDVCVAYHTDRADEAPPGFASGLKQVEVALFRYEGGQPETWTHVATELLGSVYLDPDLQQARIKCERPDVIAAGDGFFVTWTRHDDRSFDELEPAIIEGAWILRAGAGFTVLAGSTPGLGIELDRHTALSSLHVRECSGVADAVYLGDLNGPGTRTAAVVYPHQTSFHHLTPFVRRFDLRVAACTLDANAQISRQAPQTLVTGAEFDGPNDPVTSPGLILPDLAPGAHPGRFWLSYEEQLGVAGSLLEGRVQLQFWERDAQGLWAILPGGQRTFGSAASNMSRRRSNLASDPQHPGGLEIVSIAFNRAVIQADADVAYEQWQYGPGVMARVPWTLRDNFVNSALNDVMPVPVLGPGFLRRCYVNRKGALDEILEHVNGRAVPLPIASSALSLGRPAAAYLHDPSSSLPHYTPITWEETPTPGAELEVRLRVR